jgi:hypothetical protein
MGEVQENSSVRPNNYTRFLSPQIGPEDGERVQPPKLLLKMRIMGNIHITGHCINILSRERGTIDGVWIGNWIY